MSELLDSYTADAEYKSFPSFQDWKRNAVVDAAKWDRYASKISQITEGATEQLLVKAREVVKRATAWDTGSIEGLYDTNTGVTMTIALESSMWETTMGEKGEDAPALFKAQLHAYSHVLDFATKSVEIVPTWIRLLHADICAPQKTYRALTPQGYQQLNLPKGEYKSLPNHVIGRDDKPHYYAPVDITPQEMDRLCKEMQTDEFLSDHPVLQSSYAHYAFILIHPFADGNGRVARALASVFTYRALSIPLMILMESRGHYLSALMEADNGKFQPFVDFVMERAFDSVRLFEESVKAANSPNVDDVFSELQSLYFTKGGYTHEQVDQAGALLFDLFHTTLFSQVTNYLSSQGGLIQFNTSTGNGVLPFIKTTSRKPMSGGQSAHLMLSTKALAAVSLSLAFSYEVPKDSGTEDEIIINNNEKKIVFEARITELIPEISPALRIRINMTCERIYKSLVRKLADSAKAAHAKSIGS